jgi:ketosteroid isomerase-like protein
MKRVGTWGLVFLIAVLISVADGTSSAKGGGSRTEQELIALETAWDDAVAAKDRATLERIVADDFVVIGADGTVADKRQMIESIMTPELTIEPFKTEDVLVRVYGNTAVLTGRFSQRGTYKGQSFEVSSRYTDVYVKTNGRWRAVSAHATRMPKKAGG